jgi:tRNA G10  N-methylase Trm11
MEAGKKLFILMVLRLICKFGAISKSDDSDSFARREGYIHPKKSYSFDAMMDDILEFAALTLVDGGRLAMWMPSANEDNAEHEIPRHPTLELVAVSVQAFNKCMS